MLKSIHRSSLVWFVIVIAVCAVAMSPTYAASFNTRLYAKELKILFKPEKEGARNFLLDVIKDDAQARKGFFRLARRVQNSTPKTGKADEATYAGQLFRHLQDGFSANGVVDENALKTFLREVEQLDSLARAGLGELQSRETALERFSEVVRGLRMAGRYKSNAADRNLASAHAAIAEIQSIAKHADEGSTLKAIAPRVKDFPEANQKDYRMYREAMFNGPGTGRGVDGDWFLEVKHYPDTPVSLGVRDIKAQINGHFMRIFERGVDLKTSQPSEWKGFVYDFVKDGGNLAVYREAILDQSARALKVFAAASRQKSREYLLDRMKVNGQSFSTNEVDEVLDLVYGTS